MLSNLGIATKTIQISPNCQFLWEPPWFSTNSVGICWDIHAHAMTIPTIFSAARGTAVQLGAQRCTHWLNNGGFWFSTHFATWPLKFPGHFHLVIKHGNGQSPIYRWFSHSYTISTGFPIQPCYQRDPEGTSWNLRFLTHLLRLVASPRRRVMSRERGVRSSRGKLPFGGYTLVCLIFRSETHSM